MKNILNPKLIIIVNTIPIILLFIIFGKEYTIIKSLLSVENISNWKLYGTVLASFSLVNLLYTIYLILNKKKIPLFHSVFMLLAYLSYVIMFMENSRNIIPFSIPRWMMPENLDIFVYTFIMPTLFYSLFTLVIKSIEGKENLNVGKNIIIVFIIPFTAYLISLANFNLRINISNILLIFLALIPILVFFFFLIRSMYILFVIKDKDFANTKIFSKYVIAIVFPIIGLYVNSGYSGLGQSEGVFGNFNSLWFWVLAIVNGIILIAPISYNKNLRLFHYILKTIFFAYTLYFFMVFLPFLPLSIFAIILFGAGILMLTPLALFMIHLIEIYKDFSFLNSHFTKLKLYSFTFFSFLVIPFFITLSHIYDRHVLEETLEYLYSPDYLKEYKINKYSLKKTLKIVENNKSNFFTSTPYLSTFFNWLVLDNLTLSDQKIDHINKVIFAKTSERNARITRDINSKVKLQNITTKSIFDEEQQAWKSTIELEIKNFGNIQGEYLTSFELPVGCWISDYYLYIGDRKEYGILAEKKAAMWIYSQIKNYRRDPGILYYLSGNKVGFRVFPFAKEETRITGIEFIHKEPFEFIFDKKIVKLGNNIDQKFIRKTKDLESNAIYVSAEEKTHLDKINRKPYYHFLVDVSDGKSIYTSENIKKIENFLERKIISKENALISLVNYNCKTYDLKDDWKKLFDNQKYEGSFFLERAVKSSLLKQNRKLTDNYPVFIVVTDNFKNAILENDFADYTSAFPESNFFYSLEVANYVAKHSLINNPKLDLENTKLNFLAEVLAYPNKENAIAYLPNNKKASIVVKENLEIKENKEKNWQTALSIQAKYNYYVMHPEIGQKEWKDIVKLSFKSKIMTAFTSYLAVENDAQKAMLKKKQEQILSSNKNFDAGEETLGMSEPNYLIVLIIFIAIIFLNKRFKNFSKIEKR